MQQSSLKSVKREQQRGPGKELMMLRQMMLLQQDDVSGNGMWPVGRGKSPRDHGGEGCGQAHGSVLQKHASSNSSSTEPGPSRLCPRECLVCRLLVNNSGLGGGREMGLLCKAGRCL